jgi:lipopolysaccharide transport system ATP-binding protein
MDDIAIRVEGLSKCYRIQQGARAHYSTLRDTLVEAVRAPFHRRSSPDFAGNDSYIWALKDVSFEVKRGEVVGIIGRNGAGKTTLLKILSRITEPTEGYAELRGRVGSLLEVGTGFHPELTGRENIYLNGAILGMGKAEIDRKFDEIVAFAEVEKFIDTPVKFYSSGMYVRLAFAVAAHLDPDILLVDEVLAVGDAAFQKKCLGKMGDVAKEGRTVLFVSHDMGAIQALCQRVLWIDRGYIRRDADASTVIRDYLEFSWPTPQSSADGNPKKRGAIAIIESVRVLDSMGAPTSLIPLGESAYFELSFRCTRKINSPIFVITIRNRAGVAITSINSYESLGTAPEARQGGKVRVRISNLTFVPGEYHCDASLWLYNERIDYIENCVSFTIVPSLFYPTGKYPNWNLGLVCLPCDWILEYE